MTEAERAARREKRKKEIEAIRAANGGKVPSSAAQKQMDAMSRVNKQAETAADSNRSSLGVSKSAGAMPRPKPPKTTTTASTGSPAVAMPVPKSKPKRAAATPRAKPAKPSTAPVATPRAKPTLSTKATSVAPMKKSNKQKMVGAPKSGIFAKGRGGWDDLQPSYRKKKR